MCIKNKSILNASNHYDVENDKLNMSVPCGHCVECLDALRKDWFVRCFYEYKNTRLGATFFYTLTFDDEHLPRFSSDIPCFSRPMVQNFLKRLRKELSKFDLKLRYMIVSEFGEERGRPHHHPLFFLSKPVNPHWFYKVVSKAWSYGFVMPGRKNNGVVTDSSAITYVTKYVTKDFVYTDKFFAKIASRVIARYNNVIRQFSRLHGSISIVYDEYGSIHYKKSKLVELSGYAKELALYIVNRIKREIRKYLPFHLQSSKLGLSMLNEREQIDFDKEMITYLDSNGSPVELPLPRYIKRKLWYDAVPNEKDGKNNLFRLNDAGKLHYKKVLENRINESKLRFDTIKANMSLLGEDAPLFISKLSDTPFNNIEEIDLLVSECPYTSYDMAVYSNIYRGRVCPIHVIGLDYSTLIDSCFDYAERCIDKVQRYDFGNLHNRSQDFINMLERHLWDKTEQFQLLERYVQVIDAINCYIKTQVSEARLQRDKLARKTRDHFKYI